MVTIDSKLKSLEHSLLDKIEDKTMSLSQITLILEVLQLVTSIRETNSRLFYDGKD